MIATIIANKKTQDIIMIGKGIDRKEPFAISRNVSLNPEIDLKPDILPVLLTGIRAVKNGSKNLKVEKRKLSYYTSIVSLLGGAL
jgi:hypothetical protein